MKQEIRTVDILEIPTKDTFNEEGYLNNNLDIKEAVAAGTIRSGRHHFLRHGLKEKRAQIRIVADYEPEIRAIRKEKTERIQKILKKDINIELNDNLVFDYTGITRKEKFGFSETENVSAFFYDQTPLDIINSLPDGLILDCGAGFRPVYYENVVNYEIVPYSTTDVVGFAEDLPFADNSFDAVFSFAVLEHVKLPFVAAAEMTRVLKPGGTLAVCAAFLQPVHGYPHHYFNMTSMGLKVLFEEQIDIEKQFVNSGTGPIWTIAWMLRNWSKNLGKKEKRQFLGMKVADLIKHPFEHLDKPFVSSLPQEINFELANATLLVGKKKS
ncbi:MAG: class I SAM-dependent methyltransferase [Desulforhopalus sp.]|nr:class I SAM-dependent methyltransferase [Desulforhopalus sp.]